MADLIDREKLINDGISKGFCDWYTEIKNAPKVEIEERKVGKWIELKDFDCSDRGDYLVKCSICDSCNGYDKSNYCPNCGADMRGREE